MLLSNVVGQISGMNKVAHESLQRQDQVHASSDRAVGLVFAVMFLLIGLFPWFFGGGVRLWSLIVGGVFVATALLTPALLGPLNRVWSLLGLLLHKLMTPFVLGVMFFLVITPMGVVMRMFGGDPLRLRFDRQRPSYWLERSPPGPKPDTFSDQF